MEFGSMCITSESYRLRSKTNVYEPGIDDFVDDIFLELKNIICDEVVAVGSRSP